MDINQKSQLILELSYLYSYWGDYITEDESDLITQVLNVSTQQGIEFISDEVWAVLDKIYKKYENQSFETEEGEGE